MNVTLETEAQAAARRRLEAREVAALATIPAHISGELRIRCERYARIVAAAASKEQLAHIAWPWTPRPARTRTARGRQGLARSVR